MIRSGKLGIFFFYVIGWTFSLIAFSLIRGVGTKENGPIDFDVASSLALSVPMGMVFGIISALIQTTIEKRFYKKVSLAKLLVIKGGLMILFIFTLVTSYYLSYRLIIGEAITFQRIAFNGYISLIIYTYWILVDLSLTVIRQVDQMLGKGTLKKVVTGQYYRPTEMFRVFMFLDLQSSTTIAEAVGHKQYSEFIQDCFLDLEVVESFKCEVYQYVGDEVILTWDKAGGLENSHCIRAFFAFKNRLEERSTYYQEKYGFQPKFKAGMNAGVVTCTEVGSIKKEIAYHGDVLNVAARIQKKCNDYQVDLLLSDQLLHLLPKDPSFIPTKHGSLILKGKQQPTALYSMELKP